MAVENGVTRCGLCRAEMTPARAFGLCAVCAGRCKAWRDKRLEVEVYRIIGSGGWPVGHQLRDLWDDWQGSAVDFYTKQPLTCGEVTEYVAHVLVSPTAHKWLPLDEREKTDAN